MAKIPPPTALTAWRVDDSNEVVSAHQIRWLRRKALKGCTAKCLACHFSELYLRDLNPKDIQLILDGNRGDLIPTDLPSHGEQFVSVGAHPVHCRIIVVPDGVYHTAVSMVHGPRQISWARTAFFLSERWATELNENDISAISAHWLDRLPRDENGVEIMPAEIEAAPHPGNRMHQLTSIPTTPRNNRQSRSSFTRPPPNYSPRPNWNGVELRHAREVVPQNGHLGPFYPGSEAPDPPAYLSDQVPSPPAYYSPLAAPSDSTDLSTRDGTSPLVTNHEGPNAINFTRAIASTSQPQRASPLALVTNPQRSHAVSMSPPISPLELDSTSIHEGNRHEDPTNPASGTSVLFGRTRSRSHPTLHHHSARLGDEHGPVLLSNEAGVITDGLMDVLEDIVDEQLASLHRGENTVRYDAGARQSPTASGATIQAFATADGEQEESSDMEIPDAEIAGEGHFRSEGAQVNASGASNDTNSPNLVVIPDAASWTPEISVTIVFVRHDCGILTYRATGGIARAVISQHPWRYRALTVAELEEIEDEITQIKRSLAEPQVFVDLPPTHDAILDVAGSLGDLSHDQNIALISDLSRPIQSFSEDVRDVQESFFMYTAYKLMQRKDDITRNVLSRIPFGMQYNVDNLRRAFHDAELCQRAHAFDRHLEDSARAVRDQLAGLMTTDITNVLRPYDLDKHLECGTFQSEVFGVEEKDLDTFLHTLPMQVNIFTEDDDNPLTWPRADAGVDAHVTRLTHIPIETCSRAKRREMLHTLCHNIVAEILRPATVFNNNTFLDLLDEFAILGAICNYDSTRMFMEHLEGKRDFERPLTAPMSLDTTTMSRPPLSRRASGMDIEGAYESMEFEDSLTQIEPASAHVELPFPTPQDVIVEPDRIAALFNLRLAHGSPYHHLMSHFGPGTVWTPTLLAALPGLISNAGHLSISHSHTIIKILRSVVDRAQDQSVRLGRRSESGDAEANDLELSQIADTVGKLTELLVETLLAAVALIKDHSRERSTVRPEATRALETGWMMTGLEIRGLEMMLDASVMWLDQLGIRPGSGDSGQGDIIRRVARPEPLPMITMAVHGYACVSGLERQPRLMILFKLFLKDWGMDQLMLENDIAFPIEDPDDDDRSDGSNSERIGNRQHNGDLVRRYDGYHYAEDVEDDNTRVSQRDHVQNPELDLDLRDWRP